MIYSIKLGAKVHEQQNPILILMHEMSRHPLQQLVHRTSLHSCTNVVNTDTCVKSEAGCKHYILPIFTLPGGVRVHLHFRYTSFLEDRETLPLIMLSKQCQVNHNVLKTSHHVILLFLEYFQ